MRKLPTRLAFNTQAGFSIIENMIAVVLLTVGALGLAASTATSIKVNGDNQARAMALSVASKTLEPIYILTQPSEYNDAKFTTRLGEFIVANAAVPATQGKEAEPAYIGVKVTGNQAAGADEDFTVSITGAFDSGFGTAKKNVLTTAGPYISPITVAVLVTYTGNAGYTNASGSDELKGLKKYYASFTYVLPPTAAP